MIHNARAQESIYQMTEFHEQPPQYWLPCNENNPTMKTNRIGLNWIEQENKLSNPIVISIVITHL